jgi:hypothetical protein
MTGFLTAARFRDALVAIALCPLALGFSSASHQATTAEIRPTQAGAATDAGVRSTLQKYEAALESLDADAVRRVQPSIRVESLAKAFREMRELKVDIDDVRVLSVEGPIARVSCRVTQTLTPRAGSKQTSMVNRVMRLRRQSDLWVIDGFER